jgi:hypothetical protein
VQADNARTLSETVGSASHYKVRAEKMVVRPSLLSEEERSSHSLAVVFSVQTGRDTEEKRGTEKIQTMPM